MNNPNTYEFWDNFYVDHTAKNFLTPDRFLFARKIVDMFNICGDVLDVGCGTGTFLASTQGNRYGMDFVPSAIENNICKGFAELKLFDINNGIPFDKSFDFIVLIQTLEHLDNPKKVLEFCKNKLNTNGK